MIAKYDPFVLQVLDGFSKFLWFVSSDVYYCSFCDFEKAIQHELVAASTKIPHDCHGNWKQMHVYIVAAYHKNVPRLLLRFWNILMLEYVQSHQLVVPAVVGQHRTAADQ